MEQLRDYRVLPNALAEWVKEWDEKVRPLREQHGFKVVGAWTIEAESRFVWILSWEGDVSFEDADRAYYESPERLALAPDPARHIVSSEHWMLRRAST